MKTEREDQRLHFYTKEEVAKENAALREALKELIPIAEDRLFAIHVKSLEGVAEAIDRARKLIEP